MTIREALEREPRQTVEQLVSKTGMPAPIVNREVKKYVSKGQAREVVYVDWKTNKRGKP